MLDASHLPNIIALSPFERPDARLVAAFGNAGAFGILDLGRDPEAATVAVSMLEQSFDGTYGVRIPSGVELDPETLSPQVGLVVFSAATAFQKLDGRLSLVELTQASDAGAAIEAGADGIIFKASECGGECGTKSAYMLFQEVERERPSVPFWFRGGSDFEGPSPSPPSGAVASYLTVSWLVCKRVRYRCGYRNSSAHSMARKPVRSAPCESTTDHSIGTCSTLWPIIQSRTQCLDAKT